MSRIRGIRRLFRLPLSAVTAERDVDDEIEFHVASRAEELEARGLEAGAARRRAEREFGGVAEGRAELVAFARVRVQRSRRAAWWDGVGHELRAAVRGLSRSPGFTAAVILMLALGIGANAAMFGLVDRLLLSGPPHVDRPDELVRIYYQRTPSWDPVLRVGGDLPYADYVALRRDVGGFAEVAAYGPVRMSVLGHGAGAMEVQSMGATPSYFRVLGTRPASGRFFAEDEGPESAGAGERLVVLSHGLWQSRFGGASDVIGSDIHIDQRAHTVVGVAPRGFHGLDLERVDVWVSEVPPNADWGDEWRTTRDMSWLRLVARLSPGVSAEAARAEATTVYLAAAEYQERYADDSTAAIILGSGIAARAPAVGVGTAQRSGHIALWLLGMSGIVLIIACANAANLLLARGLRRRREIAVRLAMGVSRSRIAGHVLAETLIIATLGMLLGLLFAHWIGQFARALVLPDFVWTGSPVNGRVLLFAGASGAACALFAALGPALHATRLDAAQLLVNGGRGSTYRKSRVRSGLVALQAMLAALLLVGAGLFVLSLHNARTQPMGYDYDRVALLSWHTAGAGWDRQRSIDVYDVSLDRVQALTQVEAAALSMSGPFWSGMGGVVRVPGRDSVPPPPHMIGFMYDAVSPDYFRALGTRIVRGRAFTSADDAGAPAVAVVTEAFASHVWPGEDALGQCFMTSHDADAPCRQVVGVVESLRYRNLEDHPHAMHFLPLAQGPAFARRVLTVRTRGDPAHAVASLRAALSRIEPGLPHVQVHLLRERVEPQLQPWRMGATLFASFGLLALLLAGLGLYAVIAYDVTQRTREFGVRAALGARAPDVVRLVLGDAVRVVGAGLAVGLGVALWAAPRVEALLFGVDPRDHLVYAAVVAMLLIVGCVAAVLPGWRAVRIEPVEALRQD